MQPPLVIKGPVIEIRIRSSKSLEQLAETGWMSTDAATYLAKAVAECRNIVVAGPRGSGVTEVMSALARELPKTANAVAIEAVPDLDIDRNRMISLTAADSGISLGEAIEHGTRLEAEHLVINDLAGADTMTALAAVLGCEPGHLLGVHCWERQRRHRRTHVGRGMRWSGTRLCRAAGRQRSRPRRRRAAWTGGSARGWGSWKSKVTKPANVSYQSVPF